MSVLVQDLSTGRRFGITCTHLHWDPSWPDVKLLQVHLGRSSLTLPTLPHLGDASSHHSVRLNQCISEIKLFEFIEVLDLLERGHTR